jgi:peptidoglycan/LPS O-acetylase OafA/YrhL
VPGGYVGVDVFFVISGFLITSLLLREVERTGSVRLREFWARRMRRLLPAAFLVLGVSALGVLALEPRVVWPQFFREILAAGLYVENWVLAIDSVNYLAASNTPSPAQHYWTLSAEEQFYVVWPLLVLLALWFAPRLGRGRRHALFLVLAAAAAASLAYSLWVTSHDPSAAYFVTPARAWEFGTGAVLAFVPRVEGRVVLRVGVGWAALVVLVGSAFVLDAGTPMPGTAAIVVVLASAAVIWVGAPRGSYSHARLLSSSAARWLGDVSYPVYLWHWPLIILLPGLTGHPLTTLDRLSVLLATLGLAALTKAFVEDPVRRARRFGLARPLVTFGYAGLAAALLVALCLVPREAVLHDNARAVVAARDLAAKPPPCFGAAAMDPRAKGCPDHALDRVIVPAPAAAVKDTPQYSVCYARAFTHPTVPCRFGTAAARADTTVPHVAVVGDSHARVLMTALEPLVDQGRITADMFVMGECAWSTAPSADSEIGQQCTRWRARVYPYLSAHAEDYDVILTTARLVTLLGTREARVRGLSQAWRAVTSQGVPVGVVRDNPGVDDPSDNPNLCLAKVAVAQANASCAFTRTANVDRWFDALSAAQARTPGTTLIDLTDLMCSDEQCPVVIGGVDVYSDGNHLTRTFARTLAPYLYRAMLAHGLLTAQRS